VSAIFSPCRTWRYTLMRAVAREVESLADPLYVPPPPRTVAFIGLNPSTADETTDDPTVRRCVGFAKRWGYDRMVMLNVFAYRSTDPKALYAISRESAVGPDNDMHICMEAMRAEVVVCCWGVHGRAHDDRGTDVRYMLERGGKLHVLGLTKDGHPKHPLYLRGDLTPTVWGR
jgi:hypothetical protein